MSDLQLDGEQEILSRDMDDKLFGSCFLNETVIFVDLFDAEARLLSMSLGFSGHLCRWNFPNVQPDS